MYSIEYNEYEIIKRITDKHELNLSAILILYDVEHAVKKTNPLWTGYTHQTFHAYYEEITRRLNDTAPLIIKETLYNQIINTMENKED